MGGLWLIRPLKMALGWGQGEEEFLPDLLTVYRKGAEIFAHDFTSS